MERSDDEKADVPVAPLPSVPPSVSSAPSLLPSRSRADSSFHRVAVLYCPGCHYLEFPGCMIHNGLLCSQKGNGFMSCSGCEEESKRRGGEDNDSMMSYICATDLSEPWCIACQHCNVVRADTLPWVVEDEQSQQLAAAVERELTDVTHTFAIQCAECRTAIFPIAHTHLLHDDDGLMRGRRTENSTADDTELYSVEQFPFRHYAKACKGDLLLVPILMSKLEGKYCGQSLPSSPCLPKDDSLVPGFLPPLRWVTGELAEAKRDEEKRRNDSFLLSALQQKEWKAPVWRDRSYVGEFGDVFVRDTELEGGMLAPSIAALELVLRRLTDKRRDSWLRGWSDTDMGALQRVADIFKAGVEVAMLAKDSLLASADKDVEEAEKKSRLQKLMLRFHDVLHALPLGGTMIVPGGWIAPKGGHGIMHCIIHNPDGSYSFTVSNTGGGLFYHPSQTDTPKSKFLCTLRFDGISRQRMLDDGFWLLFWRLQLVSSDDHDHHNIYDILIPHLTGKTIAASYSPNEPACEFRTPQRAGNCYYKSVLECLRFLCRRESLSRGLAKQLMFCIRREYIEMVWEDLVGLQSFQSQFTSASPLHDPSDLPMVRLGTRQLCYAAIKESKRGRLSTDELQAVLELVDRIERRVSEMGFEVDYGSKVIPQLLLDGASKGAVQELSSVIPSSAVTFPGFECFLRRSAEDERIIRELAGPEVRAADSAHVDYESLSRQTPRSLDDCIALLERTVELCATSAPADSMNAYFHRIALIHQLLLETLPVPLPRHRSKDCVWLSRPLLFSEQQHVVHLLLRLSRLYITSVFSIDFPANFSANHRIVTMAAIVAVCDRVLRIMPCDVSNPVTAVYTGLYDAESVYGLSLTNGSDISLSTLTASQECVDPAVAVSRGRILEYFNDLDGLTKKKLFPFPNSGHQQTTQYVDDEPTMQWVRDVCAAAGYVIDRRGYGNKELSELEAVCKWLYTDEDGLYGISHHKQMPALAKEHAEFGQLRDIMFLFKLSMVPMRATCRVVAVNRWREQDARMYWSFQGMPMSKGMVMVFAKAFDRKDMIAIQSRKTKSPASPSTYITKSTQSAAGAFGFFNIPGLLMPAAPDPSSSSSADSVTEEDVIHSSSLPHFDHLLTVEASEKLMSTLTVPYLRIPLLLAFFANKDRVDLLHHHRIQRLLSCALFEPGSWTRSDDTDPLSSVPAISGRLGSCYGLLINELLHSAPSLLSPFLTMLQFALGLDTGSYGTAGSDLILFLSHISARLEKYVRVAVQLVEDKQARSSAINLEQLKELHAELLDTMHTQLIPTMDAYKSQLANDIPQAVRLHSHIALLAQSMLTQPSQLDARAMLPALSSYLGSLAFVLTWHSSGVGIGKHVRDEEEMNEDAEQAGGMLALGGSGADILSNFASSITNNMEKSKVKKQRLDELAAASKLSKPAIAETELFTSIQSVRHIVQQWLTSDTAGAGGISSLLHKLLRAVHGQELTSPRSPKASAAGAAVWRSKSGMTGRFESADGTVEVNLQTGDIYSHNEHIQPVADQLMRAADFQAVLGTSPRHYSLLHRYANMSHYALFGLPMTLQWWTAVDQYEQLVGMPTVVPSTLGELSDANYRFGTAITTGGEWKCAGKGCSKQNDGQVERCPQCGSYRPQMSQVEKRGVLYAGQTYTRRYGSTQMPAEELWVSELLEEVLFEVYGEKRESFNFSLFLPTQPLPASADYVTLLGLDGRTWKQVQCWRHNRLCEAFMLVPHGRTVYRSLIYTSNARLCLRALSPGTKDRWKPWGTNCRYQAGNMDQLLDARDTLVIQRRGQRTGQQQMYVPPQLLYGLLPAALLDDFLFWQLHDADDGKGRAIIGQPKEGGRFTFGLKVDMQPATGSSQDEEKKENDSSVGLPVAWEATVRQVVVDEDGELEERKESDEAVYLLNMRSSLSANDQLHRLVQSLTRIEDLAHILVWSKLPIASGSLSVLRVELPRLKMTFFPRLDPYSGSTRLYSADHAGFYVTDYRDDALTELLAPLPFSLLLENDRHELRVLAINCPMHRPKVYSCPFTTELVADRLNNEWLATVKTAYYVYTVHVSHSFLLADTLSSSLFLLVMLLLSRSYAAAFRLAETCVLDSKLSSEESYIMRQMQRTTHDQHPDVHSCRLKLALAISYSDDRLDMKDDKGKSWEMDAEYGQYVKKIAHVSANCLLSLEEELQLVDMCKDDKGKINDTDVENRATYLSKLPSPFAAQPSAAALLQQPQSSQSFQVVLAEQKREGFTNPWFDFEKTVQPFFAQGWKAGMWHGIITYKRPTEAELTGTQLLDTVGDLLNDTMVGSQHKLGFLLLYELLTGAVSARLSPSHPDVSFTLGKLLTAIQYAKVTQNGKKIKSGPHYLPYAVGAILSSAYFPTPNNHERVPISIPVDRFPPLPPVPWDAYKSRLEQGDVLNRVNTPVGAFLQSVANYFYGFVGICREWHTSRNRPPAAPQPPAPTTIYPRLWSLPKPTDTACGERQLTPFDHEGSECSLPAAEWQALIHSPLSQLALLRVALTERVKSESPLSRLPFDVSGHQSASSYVAKAMLSRMDEDVTAYEQQVKEAREWEVAGVKERDWERVHDTLRSLADSMRRMREDDSGWVRRSQQLVQDMANFVPGVAAPLQRQPPPHIEAVKAISTSSPSTAQYEYVMSRYSGQSLHVTMDFLIPALLSTRAEDDLRAVNPHLTPQLSAAILMLCAAILLRTNRLGLLDRCLADCIESMRLIQRTKQASKDKVKMDEEDVLQQSIVIQTRTLTDGLTARRNYAHVQSTDVCTFDPRFLVWEYTFNLMLRPMQVQLVNDFVAGVRSGRSSVQQMLMGAGKTTVVGPLLALILADGVRLVLQVVPAALLPMSRAVLRSRFTALLPKRILTLEFDRSWRDDPRLLAKLYSKLEMARRNKGVVIATSVSVKSLFLKYIELLHQLDTVDFSSITPKDDQQLQAKSVCADALSRIIALFRSGVLMMDEVDLLLHPLKSELNFPIGARLPLEPSPERWLLALHLIDALFYHSTRFLSLAALHDVPEASQLLSAIRQALDRGMEQRAMQAAPHLLLLNDSFYHSELKPLLARWCLLFLRAKGVGAAGGSSTATQIVHFLCHGWNHSEAAASIRQSASSQQMQLLNLSYDWLNSYLPHCMHKVNRVGYGLLGPDDIATGDASSSRSRGLVAVPFVAKDVPSRSSEFSHPDVLIGLTTIAYRIEGLRKTDVTHILTSLKAAAADEMGPEHLRPSAILFDQWIQQAYKHRAAVLHRQQRDAGAAGHNILHRQDSQEAEVALAAHSRILPLSKLQLSDAQQVHSLYLLLRRLPSLALHYLSSYVFPTCMLSQVMQLSASGQELGGSMLFDRRVGFSGTVSSLVPLELGDCGYERGADGKVMNVLTSSEVVSWSLKEKWSVLGLLDDIAAAASSPDTRFHSLIDTGALITGLDNHQVAAYLLSRGLDGFDGVVFLNRHDDAMILLRGGGPAIPLSQSGVAVERRFSFYDQVHTTGIDLKHPLNATAALTLGKDMTWRDYAQGAFRMRQIGVGQRIHLLVIPEVMALIQRELGLSEQPMHNQLPVHVAAWLTVNSMRQERLQFYQLCLQNLHNVWRKRAFHTLLSDTDNINSHPAALQRHKRFRAAKLLPSSSSSAATSYLSQLSNLAACLNLFRSPHDFSVAADVPVSAAFFEQLVRAVVKHANLVNQPQQALDIGLVLERALAADSRQATDDEQSQSFDREMVNEQEREQEKEQEKEVLRDPRASRDDEQHEVWKIEQLAHSLPFTSATQPSHYAKTINLHPFYALSSLRLAECPSDHLSLPDAVLVSHNYYKQKWAVSPVGHRRLKNVMIVLEWQIDEQQQPTDTITSAVSDDEANRWRTVFDLFTADGSDVVEGGKLHQLHRALGLPSPSAGVTPPLDFTSFLSLTQQADSSRQVPSGLLTSKPTAASSSLRSYYVLLPLVEAETLRRSIHTDQKVFASATRAGIAIGLWTLDGQLVDYTATFRPSAAAQHEQAFQAIRFFNNELFFSSQEMAALLRAVRHTPLASRTTFFARALSCRHRDRRTYSNTPVVQALSTADHIEFARLQAVTSLLCSATQSRELTVLEAFSATDHNGDGFVDAGELYALLRWLDVDVRAGEVRALIKRADANDDGQLDFNEFAAIFHQQQHEDEVSLRRRTSLSLRRTLSEELKRADSQHSQMDADDDTLPPVDASNAAALASMADKRLPSIPPLPLPADEADEKAATKQSVVYDTINPTSAAASHPPAGAAATSASSTSGTSSASAATAASGWQCPTCTFIQSSLSAATCSICGTARPMTVVQPQPAMNPLAALLTGMRSGGAEWNCPVCTLTNPPTANSCQACGTPRR